MSVAAVFDQINVSPVQIPVALGRNNSVNVTWTIQSTSTTPATVEFTGVSGEFRTKSNLVLGTVSTTLATRTVVVPANNTPIYTIFSETLYVPAYIIDSAHNLGTSQFSYARLFSGYDVSSKTTFNVEGLVTLIISSSGSGSLSITGMALSFDAGDTQRVIGSHKELQAMMRLDSRGTGLLRAIWEVAEPPSTLGEPAWRSIQQVQRSLAGNQELILKSPMLPTRDFGLYFVRLRILQPATDFSDLTILYVVEQGRGGGKVNLLGPRGIVTATAETRFSWQAVEGAQAYRLNIYTQELRVQLREQTDRADAETQIVPGKRVSGVLVKPDRLHVVLSEISLRHLQSGKRYFWQVQAIDAKGRVMATSEYGQIIGQ